MNIHELDEILTFYFVLLGGYDYIIVDGIIGLSSLFC